MCKAPPKFSSSSPESLTEVSDPGAQLSEQYDGTHEGTPSIGEMCARKEGPFKKSGQRVQPYGMDSDEGDEWCGSLPRPSETSTCSSKRNITKAIITLVLEDPEASLRGIFST